jgi:7,8-dihydroneopterin aldolase/epimerase/oxygenase
MRSVAIRPRLVTERHWACCPSSLDPCAGSLRSIGRVTDTVSIRDLRVSTVIGVYDWERETEQALTFFVEMPADVAGAAARDDLKDALDYSAVAQTVKTVVIEGKFRLIETAAERVAQRLIADYGLAWVRVQVVKPITDEGYTAVIAIERGQRQAKLL